MLFNFTSVGGKWGVTMGISKMHKLDGVGKISPRAFHPFNELTLNHLELEVITVWEWTNTYYLDLGNFPDFSVLSKNDKF